MLSSTWTSGLAAGYELRKLAFEMYWGDFALDSALMEGCK
jgi:hypothetical protein